VYRSRLLFDNTSFFCENRVLVATLSVLCEAWAFTPRSEPVCQHPNPCVLFIDEAHGISASPKTHASSAFGRLNVATRFLLSMTGIRQLDIVNLDRAGDNTGRFKSEMVVARPAPLSRFGHKLPADRIEIHILQALTEFLSISNEPIPELMLPIMTIIARSPIKPTRTS
jgi:hypothetical protein